MFESVLIANRGEIACRIIRTLRRLGIRSIAVYSDADANALHTRLADVAVRIGPAEPMRSYLDIEAIVEAAKRTGASAVHPGYGFLSENAEFATACARAGLVFIGPGTEALRIMGDKIRAKQQVAARGVPTVPGRAEPGLSDEELRAAVLEIGFPALLKPSAGGGGKGMHVVDAAAEIDAAIQSARREAGAAFGDPTLFVERFVRNPRHIEVQVLADAHGRTIHLGERECSLQRRHQKVIEEAPSPLLDAATRARIGEAACETARSVGYLGAGTVEFIVSADAPDEFFFMEMNTRLQVEHPVTEAVTGIDLVEWQLRIAAGEPLGIAQEEVRLEGHAIEARIYAEDPANGFLPTGGTIVSPVEPVGEGIRVDSGLGPGTEVSSYYDPMLAKVIVHAADRSTAIDRLRAALREVSTAGVVNNVAFLRDLLADEAVRAGRLDTELIDRGYAEWSAPATSPADFMIAAMTLLRRRASPGPWGRIDGWRMGGRAAAELPLTAEPDGASAVVRIEGAPDGARVTIDGTTSLVSLRVDGEHVLAAIDGVTHRRRLEPAPDGVLRLSAEGLTRAFRPTTVDRSRSAAAGAPELRAPMPGAVVATPASDGEQVAEGDPIVIVEAMKMEHVLRAPGPGTVRLHVAVGEQVAREALLAEIVSEGVGS